MLVTDRFLFFIFYFFLLSFCYKRMTFNWKCSCNDLTGYTLLLWLPLIYYRRQVFNWNYVWGIQIKHFNCLLPVNQKQVFTVDLVYNKHKHSSGFVIAELKTENLLMFIGVAPTTLWFHNSWWMRTWQRRLTTIGRGHTNGILREISQGYWLSKKYRKYPQSSPKICYILIMCTASQILCCANVWVQIYLALCFIETFTFFHQKISGHYKNMILYLVYCTKLFSWNCFIQNSLDFYFFFTPVKSLTLAVGKT